MALDGNANSSIVVSGSGALLSGEEAAVVNAFLREAQEEVAAQGSANVHQILDAKIRHPTPYYETQITTQRVGTDILVHDRHIVYGPWLEGTSSRNQTTRFKGYHAFRDAKAKTQTEVPRIVLAVMKRYLGRM